MPVLVSCKCCWKLLIYYF